MTMGMTGAEHFTEAQRLLHIVDQRHCVDAEEEDRLTARALAHATLAAVDQQRRALELGERMADLSLRATLVGLDEDDRLARAQLIDEIRALMRERGQRACCPCTRAVCESGCPCTECPKTEAELTDD